MVFAMTLNALLFTLSYLLCRSSITTAELGVPFFLNLISDKIYYFNLSLSVIPESVVQKVLIS